MAYLLDTHVLSETVKADPHPGVVGWLQATSLADTYLSALTLGELVQGVVRAPAKRKRTLESGLEQVKPHVSG